MRSGETLLRDGLDYVARARPVRFRAFVPLRGNGVGTACKARGIRVGNDGKARGIWRGSGVGKRARSGRFSMVMRAMETWNGLAILIDTDSVRRLGASPSHILDERR